MAGSGAQPLLDNTGHIDALILVIIFVVVAAVLPDLVLEKFGDPGGSFLMFLNREEEAGIYL